jgi:phage shock protein C
VCSTLGEQFGIDPTFLRIGFVAALFLIGWKVALVAYAGLAIYLSIQRKRAVDGGRGKSEFDRMEMTVKVRPSVHAMRTELDPIDRRLMAIESELSKPNDELAREIETLREEK